MHEQYRWRLGAFCVLVLGALTTGALVTCVGPQAIPRPDAACPFAITPVTHVPVVHLDPGTPIDWSSNPPATGPHFNVWARWNRSYSNPPLERGYWVHNLEHGGVALLYNCPDGCPEEVAAFEEMMQDFPEDPDCMPPVRNRMLVTSDPLLPADVRFAASAWGFTYTAGCFDAPSLMSFIQAHHGRGPEDVCFDGAFPGPDAGVDAATVDSSVDSN